MHANLRINQFDRTHTHENTHTQTHTHTYTHTHTHTHTNTPFYFHKQDGNDDANKPSIMPTTIYEVTESVHSNTTLTPSYPEAKMTVIDPIDEEFFQVATLVMAMA